MPGCTIDTYTCAGGAPGGHQLLGVLLLSTWMGAIAQSAAAKGSHTHLQALQRRLTAVLDTSSGKVASEQQAPALAAMLAHARCLRSQSAGPPGPMPRTDPRFDEHRQVLLAAFKLCQKLDPQRAQLLAAALTQLAEVLIVSGCASNEVTLNAACSRADSAPLRCCA
jgi:hypothetical protein